MPHYALEANPKVFWLRVKPYKTDFFFPFFFPYGSMERMSNLTNFISKGEETDMEKSTITITSKVQLHTTISFIQ